ncbi:DNA-binding MarR family transcriptional regulator [Allocatelliglobosispora scoriae]|uniref:DNA-binding MarR family transcriptional regulator n=1 Tax=Allocatelliglobosispora scoriae TaxID=643052 RepID=A0A841C205_9ACTN|nr:MarR family transcriptional regulator [Allocatelliglobosispora scoriae]MBB5872901.1 DNA-binding MarR family transcriptional regulator [Allocatelliglobosispora scoriae]
MEELIPCLARDLRAALDAELAPLGITMQQGALIMRIAQGEDSPGQLAGLVGTDTAGMTRLIDRLVGKELVRRSPRPGDRRAVVVELTEAGRELHPLVPPAFARVAARLLGGFSPAEERAADDLLRRMIENLHGAGACTGG